MTIDQLMQVRELVRQLSLQEKLYVLNDLMAQVIQQSINASDITGTRPLPSIHLAVCPEKLPFRREGLYDGRGR